MKLGILVLKEEDLLEVLIKKLSNIDINNISSVDNTSYEKTKSRGRKRETQIFSSLRYMLDIFNDEGKTIFIPMKDEKIKEVKELISNIIPKHQYYFFTIDIDNVVGL